MYEYGFPPLKKNTLLILPKFTLCFVNLLRVNILVAVYTMYDIIHVPRVLFLQVSQWLKHYCCSISYIYI